MLMIDDDNDDENGILSLWIGMIFFRVYICRKFHLYKNNISCSGRSSSIVSNSYLQKNKKGVLRITYVILV